jgi:hypothetical protein
MTEIGVTFSATLTSALPFFTVISFPYFFSYFVTLQFFMAVPGEETAWLHTKYAPRVMVPPTPSLAG